MIASQKSREALAAQEERVEAMRDYARLANLRYDNGYSGYLEVLDAERGLFSAELDYTQAKSDTYFALVDLYTTMGGGWVVDAAPSPPSLMSTCRKIRNPFPEESQWTPRSIHRCPTTPRRPRVPPHPRPMRRPRRRADAEKPKDPVKTITKGVLITLAVMFIYHVASDRVTPYTSQSNIEVLLVQIAPQVIRTGDRGRHSRQRTGEERATAVSHRPGAVRDCAARAEANLALVQQNLKVSGAQVQSTQASLTKQRTELAASKELGGIIFDLTKEKALSETDSIRARSESSAPRADVARAEADLESARQKLGPRETPTLSCSRRARRSRRHDSISPTRRCSRRPTA